MNGSIKPVLSVVVVITGDTLSFRCDSTDLAGTLEALSCQNFPPPTEIIVPFHQGVDGIEALVRRFPGVHFMLVEHLKNQAGVGGSREHHDELRAIGMKATRGDIVAFLEDHVRPDSHWCACIVEAHRQNRYAAIGGAIENGINRPLHWAVYFTDLGKYQNPLKEGETTFASVVNVSYKRAKLESIRPIWQEKFNETIVNGALIERGEKIVLSARVIVRHYRHNLRLGTVMREFFIWGRSYALTRSRLVKNRRRNAYAILSPLLPGVLLLRMTVNLMRKGRNLLTFVKTFPITALLTTSWSCGELVGYFTSRSNGFRIPSTDL